MVQLGLILSKQISGGVTGADCVGETESTESVKSTVTELQVETDLSDCPAVPLAPLTMAEAPAVLYLPLGGGAQSDCQPAAGAKLSQLVPLM